MRRRQITVAEERRLAELRKEQRAERLEAIVARKRARVSLNMARKYLTGGVKWTEPEMEILVGLVQRVQAGEFHMWHASLLGSQLLPQRSRAACQLRMRRMFHEALRDYEKSLQK